MIFPNHDEDEIPTNVNLFLEKLPVLFIKGIFILDIAIISRLGLFDLMEFTHPCNLIVLVMEKNSYEVWIAVNALSSN